MTGVQTCALPILVVCAGAILGLVLSSTLMSTDAYAGSEAERAAREIQDARDRANAAAEAMFDAESVSEWKPSEIMLTAPVA